MNRSNPKNIRVRNIKRRLVQIAVLILFLYLVLMTKQDSLHHFVSGLFFYLNPLVGLVTALSSRAFVPFMTLGFLTVLLTLVLGRVWCGWLCPLGTVLDLARSSEKQIEVSPRWRGVKYFVLSIILLSAALGTLSLVFLDPVTVTFRALASFLLPVMTRVLIIVGKWLYHVPLLKPAVAWFESSVRIPLLPARPIWLWGMFPFSLFVGIIVLNAVKPRFFCRYLCPLGGLLAIVSRVSFVRHRIDAGKCVSCGRCAEVCHTGAIDSAHGFKCNSAECTTCLNCVGVCPKGAISFLRSQTRDSSFNSSRRAFVKTLGASAVGAVFLRFVPFFGNREPTLIRPPGATEKRLMSRCIRCGECVRVCPTGGIQPSVSWEALFTPHLVLRKGYCDYSCTSCGEICPTKAIPEMSLEEKRQEVLGIIKIDEERCIPFKEKKDCIVCEEMCPVSEKAIILEEREVVNDAGVKVVVRHPKVIEELCIGCGICEYQCPLKGEAAIIVRPQGAKKS